MQNVTDHCDTSYMLLEQNGFYLFSLANKYAGPTSDNECKILGTIKKNKNKLK